MKRILLATALALSLPAQAQIVGPVAVTPFTATGGSAPRTLADRAADRLNLRDYGAKGDGTTDDSAALTAAVNAVNTRIAAGFPVCIYVPAGRYRIVTAPPTFTGAGCIVGDERYQTIFALDVAFSGDLFSWSEAWDGANGAMTKTASSPTYANLRPGAVVKNLMISGNRASSGAQNGLAFYDRDDFVNVENVEFLYLNGRAIYSGAVKNTQQAYIRESRFSHVRVWDSGSATAPAVEFASQCTQADCTGVDSSNEVEVTNLDIYGSWGPSLVFRNANTANSLRQFRITSLRIEGAESNPNGVASGTDLLTIGDATMLGKVSILTFSKAEFISPYGGGAAVHLLAPAGAGTTNAPSRITFRDSYLGTGGGTGKAILIDSSGGNNLFALSGVTSSDTNVTVASSATVTGPITFDARGQEQTWTYAVDGTSVGQIRSPTFRSGVPNAVGAFTLQTGDGSTALGNARGGNAVDLQTARSNAIQVASGLQATIGGGSSNQSTASQSVVSGGLANIASGTQSSIGGGNANYASGTFSWSPGGNRSTDRGRYGTGCFASGNFVANGDAQACNIVLRASTSGATAVVLTSDGTSTRGGSNCVNLPNGAGAYFIRMQLIAQDNTDPTKAFAATQSYVVTKQAAANTTALSTVGTSNLTVIGGATGLGFGASADTTNDCVSFTFTPPTANTDTWRAVERIWTTEVTQ